MAEITSQPTGDISTWPLTVPSSPTTQYTKIDETIPAKDNTDYNQAGNVGDLAELSFDADAPADMDTVTKVTLRNFFLGDTLTFAPAMQIRLMDGGTELASKKFTWENGNIWEVGDFIFSGLSITKAQYNNMSVRLTAVTVNGDEPPIIQ